MPTYDVGTGVDGDLIVPLGVTVNIDEWYNALHGPNAYNQILGNIPNVRSADIQGTLTISKSITDDAQRGGAIRIKCKNKLTVGPNGIITVKGKGYHSGLGPSAGQEGVYDWGDPGTKLLLYQSSEWYYHLTTPGAGGAGSVTAGTPGELPYPMGESNPSYDGECYENAIIAPAVPRAGGAAAIHNYGSGGGRCVMKNIWCGNEYPGETYEAAYQYDQEILGGKGGGRIDIAAFELVIQGLLIADGEDGKPGVSVSRGCYNHSSETKRWRGGGTGAGAGGSIQLLGTYVDIGTNKISVKGGTGGPGIRVPQSTTGQGGNGGNGGKGRALIYSDIFTGSDVDATNTTIEVPPIIFKKKNGVWERADIQSCIEMAGIFKPIKSAYVEINNQIRRC